MDEEISEDCGPKKDLKTLIEDYEDEFYKKRGKPNPDADRIRRERERKSQLYACAKTVRGMCRHMLKGKDWDRVALLLGVERRTLDAKVRQGRFTASELVYLADICGYWIDTVEKAELAMLE